jgi:predicted DNA-binding transcriptional regulator AlpA
MSSQPTSIVFDDAIGLEKGRPNMRPHEFGPARALETRGPEDAENGINRDSARILADRTTVAKRYALAPSTISKLVSAGKFPRPIKLGRAARWDLRVTDEFISAGAPSMSKWDALRRKAR